MSCVTPTGPGDPDIRLHLISGQAIHIRIGGPSQADGPPRSGRAQSALGERTRTSRGGRRSALSACPGRAFTPLPVLGFGLDRTPSSGSPMADLSTSQPPLPQEPIPCGTSFYRYVSHWFLFSEKPDQYAVCTSRLPSLPPHKHTAHPLLSSRHLLWRPSPP